MCTAPKDEIYKMCGEKKYALNADNTDLGEIGYEGTQWNKEAHCKPTMFLFE